MSDPPAPPPPPKKCGFHGSGNAFVLEADLRADVVKAAEDERKRWFDSASKALQNETTDERFGDLVRYWLAGHTGTIRPDKLEAMRAAIESKVTKITYGNLTDSTLGAAIKTFGEAEKKVNDWAADVYMKSEVVDSATVTAKEAKTAMTLAETAVTLAKAAVIKAEARVKNASTGAQAAVDAAKAALSAATMARKAKEKDRDDKKKASGEATRALEEAKKGLEEARTKHKQAKTARAWLDPTPETDKERNKRNKKKILKALEKAEEILLKAGGTQRLVETALEAAHRSRADMEAWSAVFVVSCVRKAAIDRKLEAIDNSDIHRGQDGLLMASRRHSDYVAKARERKDKAVGGTYHAFEPAARIVQIGDIICTDRRDFIPKPERLKDVERGLFLHGDIVTRVEEKAYAETIGGNVGHTVRRRRYPLNAQGRLVVSPVHLFVQEDDTETFAPPTPPKALVPMMLPVASTRRILALLSLVEECIGASATAPTGKRAPSGRKERFVSHLLESLESPFLDEEILPPEPQDELDFSVERLVAESPFEQFMVETLETESTRRDMDEGEHLLSDEQSLDSADADELDGEPMEVSDEDESDDSLGEDHLHEEVDQGLASEALTEEQEEGSSLDEGEYEEAVDFEQEDKDLAPADTVDERAAQSAFPQTIRDRIEPLPDAKRVGEASAWNSAQHPSKSGIGAAALRTRFDRYLNRAAIEKAMRDSPGLSDLSTNLDAVLAVLAHQFQQKIYASTTHHDGRIGEGTLDALGFVRHRGDSLNPVDALNQKFHVRGSSKAFNRIKEVYKNDKAVFEELGSDVSPKTWYCLFVNAPFLGRPFVRGMHVELVRRLRQAEKWLLGRPLYRGMSPVELGAALGMDEDHRGGRTSNNSSMHTLGLAVDIGYVGNPWVTGQHDREGKPNKGRNSKFQDVTRNVSRLLGGTDEVLTPQWLSSLGSDPARTTESVHIEIQLRHTSLQVYLSLEKDPDGLKTAVHRRSLGLKPDLVIERGESIDAAVRRWRKRITGDRGKLQDALGSRKPANGFLNLHRDLVIALRDHGCLAWGAIDLGARQSGDMMHFDCRATGIGWKLAKESQRTAGAGHPCSSKTEAREESETPGSAARLTGPVDFRGGRLWAFTAGTLPIRVAVFCPKIVRAPKKATVLVYAHGHLAPCPPVPKAIPEDLITKAPFELGRIVDASNREIVLVVPFLDWANLTKNKLNFEACGRSTMHLLGTPAHLNGLVGEVLAEVGRVFGSATPSLQGLILSGHSRAYDFLNPLALAHADPEMSRGALASLSHVWALDTTYVCFVAEWLRWLASKTGLRIEVFYRKVPGTKACGDKLAAAVAQSGGRLTVTAVREGHCQVPGRRLPGLLNPPGPSATPEVGDALDEGMLDEPLGPRR